MPSNSGCFEWGRAIFVSACDDFCQVVPFLLRTSRLLEGKIWRGKHNFPRVGGCFTAFCYTTCIALFQNLPNKELGTGSRGSAKGIARHVVVQMTMRSVSTLRLHILLKLDTQ